MLLCGMQNGAEPFCAWEQGGWFERIRKERKPPRNEELWKSESG